VLPAASASGGGQAALRSSAPARKIIYFMVCTTIIQKNDTCPVLLDSSLKKVLFPVTSKLRSPRRIYEDPVYLSEIHEIS
jgi:hypothetical protein